MLSRLVMSSTPLMTMSFARTSFQKMPVKNQILRQFHREGPETMTRAERLSKERTFRERLMQPAGPNAFAMGKGALAGGSALALGALCFYGLGLSNDKSTVLNQSMMWPEYVRQRVRDTYFYFGSSIVVTAASAAAVFRSPMLFSIATRSGWISIIATMALMIGSGMVARSIPYEEGLGTKQFAWLAHSAIMGGVLAPLSLFGGPILIRAAWYTAGIVGGLSTLAACAPSDKFLYMGGPLAIGLGVVFASSLASAFLPATTALGAGLYSMSLYGGLVLFSGFLLYDTQRIVRKAETHPISSMQKFDPINAAISIYMDTLNIFIRIVSILAGQGNRRR